jgi:hypothetical protein
MPEKNRSPFNSLESFQFTGVLSIHRTISGHYLFQNLTWCLSTTNFAYVREKAEQMTSTLRRLRSGTSEGDHITIQGLNELFTVLLLYSYFGLNKCR